MHAKSLKYCSSIYHPSRRISRVVTIGDCPLGGSYPVRIQSMVNTPTMDTDATVKQAAELFDAGCDYVRITARNIQEARHLAVIKRTLHQSGYKQGLIADVHFNPDVALVAARIVEKVRINPGNYVDKAGQTAMDLSERAYEEELERIADRLQPLIEICKTEGTSLRVGTNHGSLSPRILMRYGNTPEGMVQSAMEFVRIIHKMGFHQLVLSMKASDIRIMVQAYRLLINRMDADGYDYPLHLGVTEAGDGLDGIIRSAAGIGPLLDDGIGDTIRVSLTGNPLKELEAAKILAELLPPLILQPKEDNAQPFWDPFSYRRWDSIPADDIGAGKEVALFTREKDLPSRGSYVSIDCHDLNAREKLRKWAGEKERKALIIHCTSRNDFGLKDKILMSAAASRFLIDGFGDALWIDVLEELEKEYTVAGLSLLQAHGLKRSTAEFISCPSCGRTEFDIEKVLAQVRENTSHYKHLKIAVMGCIVNGPGEMMDADFGIVGMGKKKVAIYVKGESVLTSVPEDEAVVELLKIIRQHEDIQS